eukprot:scaffold24865_cov48-Phaeocystis_antarctica.AAC.1
MGTKTAKLANRPTWPIQVAKPGLLLFPVTEDLFAKRASLRGRTKVAKVGPRWARFKSAKAVKCRAGPSCLGPPGAPPLDMLSKTPLTASAASPCAHTA